MNTTSAASTASTTYGAGLLRITFGVVMLAHALLKIFVFTMPGTVGYFASQGFPGWTAYPVVLIEVVSGLLLILGLQTRLAALATVPVLLGALLVHAGNGWVFSAQNGGWEFPAMLVVTAIVVALLGEGAFALGTSFAPRNGLRRQTA
jgi:putative oxidoreductase